MTYVALALVVGIVLQTLAFSGLLLRQERRHGRRVDGLLDRLAHAHGRTWTPPPADNGQSEEPPRLRYDRSPEQAPDL